MPGILDYFPYDKPRPSQLVVLDWVERNWGRYDVMVLQAPVAAGKSVLADTIAKWANDVHGDDVGVTTPTNVLVNQYKSEFNMATLPPANRFAGRDLYVAARDQFKQQPIKLMNNYTLLANRAYSRLQIMDEAHELIPMLQDFEGVTAWQHLHDFPSDIRTVADTIVWAGSLRNKFGDKIVRLLSKNPQDYTIDMGTGLYRNQMQNFLRIYPLTPKNNKPILWPYHKVRKLILMSATIGPPDIEDLGLHLRRVGYIEVPSDIPKENRPLIYAGQGSMGRDSISATVGKIDDWLARQDQRTFMHATYNVAARMNRRAENVTFHGPFDKQAKLHDWMSGEDTNHFVGCGLTTGLNLKGNRYQRQAIAKCQFPDLGDPAVMAKATQSPEWYRWATAKSIIQAYGRICRAPDDYGETYILDSDFVRLYQKAGDLFPKWFREAIR